MKPRLEAMLQRFAQWPARHVWWLVVIWAVTILILSSQSGSSLPKLPFRVPHLDKIVHFSVFAIGGCLMTWAFSRWPMTLRKAIFLGIAGAAFFGMVDELYQLLTPGRNGADFYDWLADLTGAIVGALFAPPVFLRWGRSLLASSPGLP